MAAAAGRASTRVCVVTGLGIVACLSQCGAVVLLLLLVVLIAAFLTPLLSPLPCVCVCVCR